MMSREVLKEITLKQDEIIQILFDIAPQDWLEIILNFEVADNGNVSSLLFFAICKDGKSYREEGIRLSAEARSLLKGLWNLYSQLNDSWTTLDLRLLSNGVFNFNFSYDEPYRLSNELLEDPRFENYHINYQEKDSL